jgi:hypothetical protein
MTMPGATQEHYEKINEKIFGHYPMDSEDAPNGLIVHSAGPLPEGWWVYDIWETKKDFQRFGRERIEPAVREVTGAELDDQEIAFYDLANYYLPPALEPTRA